VRCISSYVVTCLPKNSTEHWRNLLPGEAALRSLWVIMEKCLLPLENGYPSWRKTSVSQTILGALEIKRKFNLARAPWWGGFFERLIGIMKSLLTFQELEEVLLYVEMTMNNRPLMYQGKEFEKPVFTPNTLLIPILEEDLQNIGEEDVTNRVRFLEKSKQHLRKRFTKENVHALEERQQRSGGK